MSDTIGRIQVLPVAGRIGAEIRGVRLSPDLPPAAAAEIRRAWLAHKVVFFRGQDHLSDAELEALAPIFGAPAAPHPLIKPLEGTASVVEFDSRYGNRANAWHSDLTYLPAYPRATLLRALVIPPAGGDTVWANTALAYQQLPPDLRALADRLRAVHSSQYAGLTGAALVETEHPVVRVHPETRERTLVLGYFVKEIVGVTPRESMRILHLLQEAVTRIENTVRWRWTVGDVAVWDNRATQHYAVDDYGDQLRQMRRVSVDGDVPVGVAGRPSAARAAVPS
jgi:alkyl sulfatase